MFVLSNDAYMYRYTLYQNFLFCRTPKSVWFQPKHQVYFLNQTMKTSSLQSISITILMAHLLQFTLSNHLSFSYNLFESILAHPILISLHQFSSKMLIPSDLDQIIYLSSHFIRSHQTALEIKALETNPLLHLPIPLHHHQIFLFWSVSLSHSSNFHLSTLSHHLITQRHMTNPVFKPYINFLLFPCLLINFIARTHQEIVSLIFISLFFLWWFYLLFTFSHNFNKFNAFKKLPN